MQIKEYSGHSSSYKINLFYYIQVGYSGQSDIVARKWWPKVATISKVQACQNSVNFPRYRFLKIQYEERKNVLKIFLKNILAPSVSIMYE